MGTRVAPNYAINFMNYFEETYVYTYHTKPLVWKRYIDDIFMIWTHGEEKLDHFVSYLNNCHPTIKFTCEKSYTHVPFLDTLVKKDQEGNLETTLYCKPTDSHSYLHFDSCHPKHTKMGLPYSEFLRLRRICTHFRDFWSNALDFLSCFLKRGYPAKQVIQSMYKAANQNRDDLLKVDLSDNKDEDEDFDNESLFAIMTYFPNYPALKKCILEYWDMLGKSPLTTHLMNYRLIFGTRRPKNIKDHIVRARLPKPATSQRPHVEEFPCLSPRTCRYCPRITQATRIRSHTTGIKYRIRTESNCNSNNLIYCIECKKCQKQYVGQTYRTLKERMKGHFGDIGKTDPETTVGIHFNLPDHNGINDISIYVLEFLHFPRLYLEYKPHREKVELKWIYRLNTWFPQGLNTMD